MTDDFERFNVNAPRLRGDCPFSCTPLSCNRSGWWTLKNITLSADEKLIEAARARAERTTLNEQFRDWLAAYARERSRIREYDTVDAQMKSKLRVGRKLIEMR